MFKQEMFSEFEKIGFGEIISIEDTRTSFDLENLTRKFPRVRFLQFYDDPDGASRLNIGHKINIGFEVNLGV